MKWVMSMSLIIYENDFPDEFHVLHKACQEDIWQLKNKL